MPVQVQFTRGGRNTGSAFKAPDEATDVHFNFDRSTNKRDRPKFNYTQDGREIDGTHDGPEKAKDVGVEWIVDEKGKFTIGDSHWTDEKGQPIGGIGGYVRPPKKPAAANDWHFWYYGGKITGAHWTRNGRPLPGGGKLDVPEDVNDAHLTYVAPAPKGELYWRSAADRGALAAVVGYLLGASVQDIGQTDVARSLSEVLSAQRGPGVGSTEDPQLPDDLRPAAAVSRKARRKRR